MAGDRLLTGKRRRQLQGSASNGQFLIIEIACPNCLGDLAFQSSAHVVDGIADRRALW